MYLWAMRDSFTIIKTIFTITHTCTNLIWFFYLLLNTSNHPYSFDSFNSPHCLIVFLSNSYLAISSVTSIFLWQACRQSISFPERSAWFNSNFKQELKHVYARLFYIALNYVKADSLLTSSVATSTCFERCLCSYSGAPPAC